MDDNFPKAIPEPRGCGEREEGGIYAESGLIPGGSPLERFLFDPPQPVPEGLDLVNKPQLWQRTAPDTGEPIVNPETGVPLYDLLIWVGAQHYPEAADYIEETRRLGASRRLNPQMDLALLTRGSLMLLAHPRAIIVPWRDLVPPQRCRKDLPFHDQAFFATQDEEQAAAGAVVGPCISKLWEVLPQEEAEQVFPREGAPPLCLRRIGSTTYSYTPSGEQVRQWQPGFILALPITGIALIEERDGSVHPRAREKLLAGIEQHGRHALPFYETDR